MSEGVSLIIWPTTAKYSLISLWFYVLCQKLGKHCNDISILKRAYLHNHWFKSYELNSIRKPRRSTLLSLCNAKWDFHTVMHHTATNPKLPNIATLSKPTVYLITNLQSGSSVDVEQVFSQGQLILPYICNWLWSKSTHALLHLGNWSQGSLVINSDIKAAAILPDVHSYKPPLASGE